MKSIKTIKVRGYLLVVLMAIASLPALAEEVAVEGIRYLINRETGTATVNRGYIDKQIAIIPESISVEGKDYSVVKIGDEAYQYFTRLEAVIIPNTVDSIGRRAFQGCKKLKSVTFGNSVSRIDFYAFEDCFSLEEIHISDLAAWCNIPFDIWEEGPGGGIGSDIVHPFYYSKSENCKIYLGV